MQGGLELMPVLAQCEWDSQFFGFKVAEISEAELDDRQLEELLGTARFDDIRLVYWFASPATVVDEVLLKCLGGRLVDRKMTYVRPLDRGDLEAFRHRTSAVHVAPLPIGPAEPKLVDLAIAAGEFSRFRSDPHFSPELFPKLYRSWITRSAMHEIADIVLVASTDCIRHVGMVTGSVDGAQGSIGLIAVAAGMRGCGIGTALIDAAHRWMAGQGAARCEVVTQEANRAACLLYERMGYRVARVSNVYHFWVGDASSDVTGQA